MKNTYDEPVRLLIDDEEEDEGRPLPDPP
jgi:hypothetical protein